MAALTDKIFYFSIAGFVAGIFLHSFIDVGVGFSWLFVLLGSVLFILPFKKGVAHSDESRDLNPPPRGLGTSFYKGGIITTVFLIAAGLGIFRYDIAELKSARTGLEMSVSETVSLEGLIADESDVREETTRLILKIDSEDVKTKILLTVSHEPHYRYGDRVQITGKLERPKNFTPTPIQEGLVWGFTDEKTLREVDYISHLEKDGIFYQMFRPKITLLAAGEGNIVIEKLFAFKNAFIENINTLIVQPHASLLGGLSVRVRNKVFDGSVRGQLDRLKKELTQKEA